MERQRLEQSPQDAMRDSFRRDAYKLLESGDPLAREIAEKILEILAIKKDVEDIQNGADQVQMYQRMKQLGIFWIRNHRAKFSWSDPQHAFSIEKGDTYLDLHLPPLTEEKKTFSEIGHSFQLIAEYIQTHQLKPKYILGITYERLGNLSRRYGFTVIDPQIPRDLTRGVENVYRDFRSTGENTEKMGNIVVCYQETEKFLRRFGDKDPLWDMLLIAFLSS